MKAFDFVCKRHRGIYLCSVAVVGGINSTERRQSKTGNEAAFTLPVPTVILKSSTTISNHDAAPAFPFAILRLQKVGF
jgi:hypothetical protein